MQNKKISAAYERVGKFSKIYDRMITNSSFFGRLAMKSFFVDFLTKITKYFFRKLLEVPISTGAISLPIYKKIPNARIF